MEVSKIRNSAGVTLVELLIVLAVAAVLAQIALPDFRDIMKNNRSATRVNELQTSLSYARSEAIKRNNVVTLCKSTNGTACVDSGSDWESGWIVFEDINNNGAVDDGEPVLTLHGNKNDQLTLSFEPDRVAYSGSGLATQGINDTFILCDDRGAEKAKGVIIGASGRPRLATDSNGNGIVEDATGTDVECS